MPKVEKNQYAEVNHTPVSAVKTRAPRVGSVQLGRSLLGKTSILIVNAPKKAQPSSECTRTRVL